MKIRMNAEELVTILVRKHKDALLNKYSLDNERIGRIREALQKGRWKIVY